MKKEGPDAEIERLVEAQFLPRRAADIIHRKHLEAFAKSDLMPLLLSAEKIYREQHFNRFIPYARLTRNETLAEKLEDYTLYVQGSIDLIIEDAAGEVWLIDYKTDHISQTGEAAVKEKLLCDHADQLTIYADAVEDLLARRPDHICIYSLPLGRLIELTEDL
jgi:ATP-dependent helicase/nuclease subunit A